MTIVAAADGSALGNPGPAGWAWYVDEHRWAAGGWPHGTNNQGELMAVLDLFRSTAHEPDEELHVLCDSQYVINTVTKWMPGWKRKGWRKADGAPVQNLELVTALDTALSGRHYSFEWVKGHAGHPLNEAADLRARAVALAFQSGSPIPSGPGWYGTAPASRPAAVVAGSDAETARRLTANLQPDGDAAPFELDTPVGDATAVEKLALRLRDPAVRSDATELAALLHPDFEEIGQAGRLFDRDTTIQTLETDHDSGTLIDVLSAESVTADAMLLVYRTESGDQARLHSSLWVRLDGRWRLRFQQATLEADD